MLGDRCHESGQRALPLRSISSIKLLHETVMLVTKVQLNGQRNTEQAVASFRKLQIYAMWCTPWTSCYRVCKLTVLELGLSRYSWQIFNPQHACAPRVTVLGLCVCLFVTQHLTFHEIIRTTNNTNLLSVRWRLKIVSDFLWKSFVAKLGHFLMVQL